MSSKTCHSGMEAEQICCLADWHLPQGPFVIRAHDKSGYMDAIADSLVWHWMPTSMQA
ncbi:MAG: hypothetical protein LUQ56_11110 [Methylococcaceae bacterium]|jgi:hypothetical protein|nr:hypothetical protein [Methylococcaceae bacterium]